MVSRPRQSGLSRPHEVRPSSHLPRGVPPSFAILFMDPLPVHEVLWRRGASFPPLECGPALPRIASSPLPDGGNRSGVGAPGLRGSPPQAEARPDGWLAAQRKTSNHPSVESPIRDQ